MLRIGRSVAGCFEWLEAIWRETDQALKTDECFAWRASSGRTSCWP